MVVCCKICYFPIFADLLRFTCFYVEKIEPKIVPMEKNKRYGGRQLNQKPPLYRVFPGERNYLTGERTSQILVNF